MTIRTLAQANAQPTPHTRRTKPRRHVLPAGLKADREYRAVHCPVCGDENIGACHCVRTMSEAELAADFAAMCAGKKKG